MKKALIYFLRIAVIFWTVAISGSLFYREYEYKRTAIDHIFGTSLIVAIVLMLIGLCWFFWGLISDVVNDTN